MQCLDMIADCGEHASHLMVAAFMQRQPDMA
jgi:hypothetical protein